MPTMRRTAGIVASFLLLALAGYPDVAAADSDEPSVKMGLSLAETRLVMGEQYEFAYTIENQGYDVFLFNPFCVAHLEAPLQLRMLDAANQKVAYLYADWGGSYRLAQQWDWVHLPPGAQLGGRLKFRVAPGLFGNLAVRPGDYTIRLFFRTYDVSATDPLHRDPRGRRTGEDDGFWSNEIKVTVVEGAGERPEVSTPSS